jgi:hypothetical protein
MMDVQRSSQPACLDVSPVEFHELHRRMLEVIDLRAKVATLEKVRSETRQRPGEASDLHAVEQRA